MRVVGCIRNGVSFREGGCERDCRSSVRGKAGEYAVKRRLTVRNWSCNENGKRRMRGMKHNYNGHKTDE
jgi:hypothetical protein